MDTLFERFLAVENTDMFLELAGHAYKLKGLCTDPQGAEYEEHYLAIVSMSTKPDEKPWRMTVYSKNTSPRGKASVVHVQLDNEYSYLDESSDGMWQRDIIDAVQEYINPDCNFLESEPINQEQMMDMISAHH